MNKDQIVVNYSCSFESKKFAGFISLLLLGIHQT